MRIEKVMVELVRKMNSHEATPEQLSRLLELALRKVGESGEAGEEALRMIQHRFVRDALSRDINIKRVRSRQAPYMKPTGFRLAPAEPAKPLHAPVMTPSYIGHTSSKKGRKKAENR
jgi:hypothetical protein